LDKIPIGITILKIKEHFIVDPTLDEEKIYDARLSVATTDDGKVCALQKGGDETITIEDIRTMISIGLKKGKELRSIIR